jgi:hypothetical protein
MTNHRPSYTAAGLIAGPGAWAVSTQAGYAAMGFICSSQGSGWIFLAAALLASVSLGGAYVSYTTLAPLRIHNDAEGHPRALLAAIGIGTGVLFSLVIALQGIAALAFTGCER